MPAPPAHEQQPPQPVNEPAVGVPESVPAAPGTALAGWQSGMGNHAISRLVAPPPAAAAPEAPPPVTAPDPEMDAALAAAVRRRNGEPPGHADEERESPAGTGVEGAGESAPAEPAESAVEDDAAAEVAGGTVGGAAAEAAGGAAAEMVGGAAAQVGHTAAGAGQAGPTTGAAVAGATDHGAPTGEAAQGGAAAGGATQPGAAGTAAQAGAAGAAATRGGAAGVPAAESAGGGAAAGGGVAADAAAANGAAAQAGAGASAVTQAEAAGGATAQAGARGGATAQAGAAGGAAAQAATGTAAPAGAAGGAAAQAATGTAAPAGSAAAGGAARGGGAGGGGAAAGIATAAGGGAGGGAGTPAEDPGFQAVKARAGAAATGAKAHASAGAEVAQAHAAAVPPGNDVASQGAAAQVETMAAQQPGTFDKAAFIDAVREAIEAASPQNLEEADEFKDSGKPAQVKSAVSGQVTKAKESSEKDIKQAAQAPPDTSAAQPKPVTPMPPQQPAAPPAPIDAAEAMPKPRPAAESDLSQGPAQVDAQMSEAGVTDEQLAKSNEPAFRGALEDKHKAGEHAAQAPQEFKQQEQQQLAGHKESAEAAAVAKLAGMQDARGKGLDRVGQGKAAAKAQDEGKRAEVAAKIEAIYNRARTAVTTILDSLQAKVDAAFDSGEQQARKQFEDQVAAQMDAYKERRYSGITGAARWLADKLTGMPDEVNVFYARARAAYLVAMDRVISNVADLIGAELNAAKAQTAEGRKEIRRYVAGLPQDLRSVGREASEQIEERFDQLDRDVDSRQQELVDGLAQRYVEARGAVDARIDEMQAANRGLVDRAFAAIGGVIRTILQLKDMLLGVLKKAGDVIETIIKDPIGFLGNLLNGIKSGFTKFVGNIAAHLKSALMEWLFGALSAAGIRLPETFDLKGILDLVTQILGLTYARIRGKVVKLIGEPAVSRMEQVVDVFKTLVTEGPAGLWKWIQEKLGDLKEAVLTPINEFLVEKVIKAAVTRIVTMFNPVGAFIQACLAIYNTVMFVIERGRELLDFVNSVLDSIATVARGNIGAMADAIEGALARALPLVINFLARLLGLGGIGDRIRSILDTIRKPVEKAVDWVVGKAVKLYSKTIGKAAGWVKSKAKAGMDWAKGKLAALGRLVKGFTMRGTKHTVYLEPGPPRRLEMASVREPIVAKLERELVLAKSDPGRQARVASLLDSARAIVEYDPTDQAQKAAQHAEQRKLAALTNAMDAYGRDYKLANLGVEESKRIPGVDVAGPDIDRPAADDADVKFTEVLEHWTAAELKSSGNVLEDARDLNVGGRSHTHGFSPEERASRGTSGATEQSGHSVPTSMSKDVPGAPSRNEAMAVNLRIAVHTKLDSYWKKWAHARRNEGFKKVTARRLYAVLVEAVNHTPELTGPEHHALMHEAKKELLDQLGPETELNLPFAKKNPPARTDIVARVAIEELAESPPAPEPADEEVEEEAPEAEAAEEEELPDELPED